ncbi:MAG: FTR1 family protein [Actinobacteria bacterium]|nr:FTR1 family protein [Actinomycetota bacterium]
MFSNFLIGLREGLEASLVVGILVAYLVRAGHRNRLAPVWAGVGAAVAVSLGVGALLTFTSRSLSFRAQEAFGGFMSVLAVVFVTGMVFWMRTQARALKHDLEGRLHSALTGGAFALFLVALFAVGREGLETALFLWTSVQAAGSSTNPIVGAAVGLLLAVVIGWLIYRQSVRLNLATFFKVTGAGLVIVAAGVLAYGIHDLQEAGILPGLNSVAFDVARTIPPSSWYGTVLKGIFNFSPVTTWLQLVAYVAYIVPVMLLFFRPMPAPATARATTTEVPAT